LAEAGGTVTVPKFPNFIQKSLKTCDFSRFWAENILGISEAK
jgi:hypothetical protein